jgi:hypothetical protein
MKQTYYPRSLDARAEWWENIQTKATAPLTALGFAADRITSIMSDAAWAVYCYRDVRVTFETYTPSVTAFANAITVGPNGASVPAPPEPPVWPTPPGTTVTCGIETRREAWVQEVKNAPGYNDSIGELLRIIAPATPFDPSVYITQLSGVFCPGPRTVSGKFRKAQGNADGIVLRGRKVGATQWTELGRFTASPFTASVPLAAYDPEAWQFQARVFRRDVEFGIESGISELIIRG